MGPKAQQKKIQGSLHHPLLQTESAELVHDQSKPELSYLRAWK